MRINNVDVASIDRTTMDASSSFRGGESVHDAPSISGDTLFNYAMNDGKRGVARFAAMADNAERQGRLDNFEDIVAREGSHYLAGIAGFNMSTTESASADARVDASAGISARTPGLNLGFASIRGEARAGVSGGYSDSRGSSRNESVDGYNVAIHDAFDRTIGNQSLGDMTTRTEAFYGELRGLQQSAIDRSEGVPNKAEDPDGVFGELGDKFGREHFISGSAPPMSDEDFQQLLNDTRYKQPGDM